MKALMTQEQKDYLVGRIGIPAEDLPEHCIDIANPAPAPRSQTQSVSRRVLRTHVRVSRVFVVLLFIILLLVLLSKVRAGDLCLGAQSNQLTEIMHDSWSFGIGSNTTAVAICPPETFTQLCHDATNTLDLSSAPPKPRVTPQTNAPCCSIIDLAPSNTKPALVGLEIHDLSTNMANSSPVTPCPQKPQKTNSLPMHQSSRSALRWLALGVLPVAVCIALALCQFRARQQKHDIHHAASPHEKPAEPDPHSIWGVACATHQGNVRLQNEDAIYAATLQGVQWLILCDGCGGLPFGGVAARTASRAALESIERDMTIFASWRIHDLLAIIERAIYCAATRLSIAASEQNIPVGDRSMRTTMIIVAGSLHNYIFGCLGDGGGVVLRAGGTVENLFEPQKADPLITNVLAASLGPWVEGLPILGFTERHSGELLIVGSDGVFDYVPSEFPLAVAQMAVTSRGDLPGVAQAVLEKLASAADSRGFICSDNLSIGLMSNSPISPAVLGIPSVNSLPVPSGESFKPNKDTHEF